MVALNREQLVSHQCLNQMSNTTVNQMNLFKLEQVQYKCVSCFNQNVESCMFSNASDYLEHASKLRHFKLKGVSKRKDECLHLNEANLVSQSPANGTDLTTSSKRFKY